MHSRSRLIAFALALCPAEFREEFGEQIHADAESHGNSWATAFDVAVKGLGLYFESFMRDVVFALRILLKTPVFTGAAILTLALAISVNVTVFGAINAVLLKPLPFVQPDRLAFVCNGSRESSNFRCTEPFHTPLRSLFAIDPTIADIGAFQYLFTTINGFSAPRSIVAANVTTNFFDVLTVKPEFGRFFTPTESDNVVISDRTWRTLYNADPHILGRAITMGNQTWHIVGVAPPQFVMPIPTDSMLKPQAVDVFTSDSIASYSRRPVIFLGSMGNSISIVMVFMRLRNGVSFGSAQAELDRLTHYGSARSLVPPSLNGSMLEKPEIDAVPFARWYSNVDNIRLLLTIALSAAVAVLFIACANIANLLLARGTSRQGELAVRSALGATRTRIIRQLVAEISVLAVVSGILGIGLAYAELRLLLAIDPGLLPRTQDIAIDGRVLLFTCAIMAVVTMLAGVVPAFLTSPKNLALTLKSSGRGRDDAAGKAFRSSLVVLEIGLAFAVIISSALLVRSFLAIIHTDMGFDPHNVYVAETTVLPYRYQTRPSVRVELVQGVINRIRAIPGVEAVATGASVPLMDDALGDLAPTIVLQEKGQTPHLVACNGASSGYFDALGIPIVRGRTFTERDRMTSTPVVVVTEAFVKMFNFADPIGKYVDVILPKFDPERPASDLPRSTRARIVGVVGDTAAFKESSPLAYVTYAQYPTPSYVSQFVLRVRNVDPHLNNEITTAIASIDPTIGIQQFVSLDNQFAKRAAPQRTSALLLSALALVGLILALVGIYAIVSYGVERRTHEFGIRKAVGAQTKDILLLVLRGALVYAFAGVALGVIFASFSTRALTNLLTQTSPFDSLTFIGAIVVLIVSTLAAAIVPAIRAMRIDPAVALRYE